jgi:hypothetical protein
MTRAENGDFHTKYSNGLMPNLSEREYKFVVTKNYSLSVMCRAPSWAKIMTNRVGRKMSFIEGRCSSFRGVPGNAKSLIYYFSEISLLATVQKQIED